MLHSILSATLSRGRGPAAAEPVSIDDVRAMAFDKGIVKIEEVELDDGIWEVEGYDSSGHEIEMKVEAASGAA